MINLKELRRCIMLTKIIRNFLLMSLFLSGVNAIAKTEVVAEVPDEVKEALNFEELKPELVIQNCTRYQPDSNKSFQPSNLLFGGSQNNPFSSQNNPFTKLENCLLQAMDKSLKPVCDEERSLKAALKKDQGDDETWEEIEETLAYLSEVKYEYADTLYEIADGINEMYVQTQANVKGEVKYSDEFYEIVDGINQLVDAKVQVNEQETDSVNILADILISEIIGGYGDMIALRARRFCGSTLRQ